ncbi:phosphoadenosine phosphosulfate reductase domain-containing protein [Maribellus mangrovi]|uniref:phosphoadenosine phosphosulfate reductase domain-containing protein n=1 Tax=Maribellus mangrovi TaxID=3133146 RepID=UPI0030EB1790
MDNLFGIEKISVGDCQELTIQSINAYAYQHDHWVIAWSGGKDSTATMTLIIYLILSGQIRQPKSLTVMYADTRMELTPLAIGAENMLKQIKALNLPWLRTQVVMSDMDHRFFVYMLGRGVPPPNNMTLRWCTQQIKVTPMQKAIEAEFDTIGEKVLTFTGVRMGESAIRDGRLSMACTKNGAECGQGWYMNTLDNKITATIAPIIHWRVCNVWDWLQVFAPQKRYGGWDTSMLIQAYGGEKVKEVNARTGCNGCPLVDEDTALDAIMEKFPKDWGYLQPLKELRPLYREMRKFEYRLRKHGETKMDGTPTKNPYRVGPLTMEARKYFTNAIIHIQAKVNRLATAFNRPQIDILNDEELSRIEWHWENNIWPQKWEGTEPLATDPFNQIYNDGSMEVKLFEM